MSGFNKRYEEIILRDVQDPHYGRNQNLVWGVFFALAGILGFLYFRYFHSTLHRNFEFILNYYRLSLTAKDPNFRTAVYIYDYMIAFILFLGVVAVGLCLALLAFDMQRRNQVIQSVLQRESLANASEKQIS